jgi:hypothetical protein
LGSVDDVKGFTKGLRRLPKPKPHANRVQHKILTDVSRHSSGTTFAGVLNPHPGGSVQAAFRLEVPHRKIPLRLGHSALILPPANIVLSEAYAVYIALSLWKDETHGGKVTCMGDNSTSVAALQEGGNKPAKRCAVEGIWYQRKALLAIARVTENVAAENDILAVHKQIPRAQNKVSHGLSRNEGVDPRLGAQLVAAQERLRAMDTVGPEPNSLAGVYHTVSQEESRFAAKFC